MEGGREGGREEGREVGREGGTRLKSVILFLFQTKDSSEYLMRSKSDKGSQWVRYSFDIKNFPHSWLEVE